MVQGVFRGSPKAKIDRIHPVTLGSLTTASSGVYATIILGCDELDIDGSRVYYKFVIGLPPLWGMHIDSGNISIRQTGPRILHDEMDKVFFGLMREGFDYSDAQKYLLDYMELLTRHNSNKRLRQ